MNSRKYEIIRRGKTITVNSCNDALGVAREAFPDIRTKNLSFVKINSALGEETRIRLIDETIFVMEYKL